MNDIEREIRGLMPEPDQYLAGFADMADLLSQPYRFAISMFPINWFGYEKAA